MDFPCGLQAAEVDANRDQALFSFLDKAVSVGALWRLQKPAITRILRTFLKEPWSSDCTRPEFNKLGLVQVKTLKAFFAEAHGALQTFGASIAFSIAILTLSALADAIFGHDYTQYVLRKTFRPVFFIAGSYACVSAILLVNAARPKYKDRHRPHGISVDLLFLQLTLGFVASLVVFAAVQSIDTHAFQLFEDAFFKGGALILLMSPIFIYRFLVNLLKPGALREFATLMLMLYGVAHIIAVIWW